MSYLRTNWRWVVIPLVLGAALVLAGAAMLESDALPSFEYAL